MFYSSFITNKAKRFITNKTECFSFKSGCCAGWKMKKCVSSYSQGRLCLGDISHLYSSKKCFTSPSLLIRRSALVLKVGVSFGPSGK